MLSLLTIFAMHISPSDYLRCEDYEWLKQGMLQSELFSPAEKSEIIIHWIEHTDPHCFDSKDAKAD